MCKRCALEVWQVENVFLLRGEKIVQVIVKFCVCSSMKFIACSSAISYKL